MRLARLLGAVGSQLPPFAQRPRAISAAVYNTPYQGIEIWEFRGVAATTVNVVADQALFQKIYLLSREPGVGAFEIFPSLAKCE